jgi:hypothetical protein
MCAKRTIGTRMSDVQGRKIETSYRIRFSEMASQVETAEPIPATTAALRPKLANHSQDPL